MRRAFLFGHVLLLAAGAIVCTAAAEAVSLEEGFRNPPNSANPHTWYHLMNGNVTKEGITCDFEALAKVGIGGVQMFDAGCDIPPGPLAGDVESGFNNILVDSYEVGPQNWTQGMEKEFEKRMRYSPLPYLPVFAGRVVGSVDESERFLEDFRRVVADLFAENYAGRHTFTTWKHWDKNDKLLPSSLLGPVSIRLKTDNASVDL